AILVSFFFFFQAEDGIRDRTVTGVQTCALPIFGPGVEQPGEDRPPAVEPPPRLQAGRLELARGHPSRPERHVADAALGVEPPLRSEERRVGKEWRCRWQP